MLGDSCYDKHGIYIVLKIEYEQQAIAQQETLTCPAGRFFCYRGLVQFDAQAIFGGEGLVEIVDSAEIFQAIPICLLHELAIDHSIYDLPEI